MRRGLGALLIGLCGCIPPPAIERECEDGPGGEVQCASYEQLDCRPWQITTVNGAKWLAYGCGHFAVCDTVHREWACKVVPPPELRATLELAVQTGCREGGISLIAAAPRDRFFGAYRMTTCKGDWICEVDDAVHCSAAP